MATSKDTLKNFLREGTPPAVVERYIALEQIAQDSNFAKLDNNVVVVDTEATGLSLAKDELIQIAAAKINNGEVQDWYVTFVDPGQEISEDIEHLTHISNDDVAGAPDPSEALEGLVNFAGDAIMLAHNASFDKSFLTKHAAGYPLLENIWVDTLDLARIAFPRLTSHRLIDLSKAFGVIESTHRADDDVATTCVIYRLALAAITQMPFDLVKTIANLASIKMWHSSYIFKEMLNVIEAQNAEFESYEHVDELDPNDEIYDENLFENSDNKVNTFAMLRTMRNERFIDLPIQKKHDVELDDVQYTPENVPIKPMDAMQFPCSEDVEKEFSKSGILGSIYKDYEERDEQNVMADKVLEAFRDSKNLVIEAGTGVGKSMAYLIPAIKVAKENEITIGIATKTNSLLDQLIYHELPALKSQIDGLVYSSLKGAKHYICLRKAAYLASSKARLIKFKDDEFCNAASIAGLLSYIEQTTYDDCDGIKINGRALPNAAYTCASHECMRVKCPFYHNGCFVHGARRMAQNSDIVVTNHSMLFCDIKANNGLLPPIRYWVVDEAHGTESEARRAFSSNVLASVLLDYAKVLDSENPKLNIFEKAARNIDTSALESKEESHLAHNEEQAGKSVIYGLINKCKSAGKELSNYCSRYANNISLLLDFSEKSKSGYEFSNVWINDDIRESEQFNELFKYAKEFSEKAENLLIQTNKLIAYLDDYKSCAAIAREISVFVFDIKELMDASDVIFFNNSDAYVYSSYLNTKKTIKQDKISAELYAVSDVLNERLYSQCKSIVFTSATLATGDSFKSFKDSIGLNDETIECQLSSSFDYDNNMTIYVANDIPDPNSMPYIDKLSTFLCDLHIAGDGSILSLFTNRRQMERTYENIIDDIKAHNLQLIMQKWGLSVKGVKDEFLANEKLSLFALKSFWEGFDAPGSTLKGVVITKLPFVRMDDPLNKERRFRDDHAWFKYTLPESVIETKQAVGRLIRKAEDKGYIVFCDCRLVNKSYGKLFLDSMPSKNIKIMTSNEIVDEVSRLDL